ncbi:hypothetical protein K525DRAFT_181093, partial [Schizophyllum commune Loenen D]
VQLIVVDLWRVDDPLIREMDRATEVVKWFNNHSLALGLLRQEQSVAHPSGKALSLILPATTRWTSHYLCIARLLDLESSLRVLPISATNQDTLKRAAGPKRDAKAKVNEIIKTILDLEFWERLK